MSQNLSDLLQKIGGIVKEHGVINKDTIKALYEQYNIPY
jgi:hypothetical protein